MKRVLALLLDAAEPELIERWMEDGSLPNLKRLRERGMYGRLRPVDEWLAECEQYAFWSGQNPAATGLYYYIMWHKESMTVRPPGPDWQPHRPFWRSFERGGPRAVVLDAPNVYPPEPFNGAEVIGWATHDAMAPFQSYPPEFAAWIHRRFSSSLLPDERYGPLSKREFLKELRSMQQLNEKFSDLCLAMMQKEAWDLLLACNATLHSAGHRLWNTVNLKDSLTSGEQADLSDAVHQVYMACDRAVGKIVDAAPTDAVVMILSLHGMGVNTSRSCILPEMLGRVLNDGAASRGAIARLRESIPVELRHMVKSRLPFHWRRGLTRYWRTSGHDWRTTRAFSMPSDTQGWVRINLKGREAQGAVDPADYDALCQEIADGLKSFVEADTGEPLVKAILNPQQVMAGPRLHDLPDLIVRWSDRPASMHRTVTSPRFGTVPWPTPGQNPEGRGGNHRAQGMLIVSGPGIGAGGIEDAGVLDLAPTILTLLDQPVPADLEGTPIQLAP
jgi:predicted AlkP superfamily phosphohydrolase/phosphomutase